MTHETTHQSLRIEKKVAIMKIAEIINLTVAQIHHHASVADAARMMRDHHVGSLVVIEETDNGRLPVGVLTDRDIVLATVAEGRDPILLRTGDVMSKQLVTIRAEDSIPDALRLMRRHGIRRLPVITHQGALIGIVALDDLLEVVADEVTGMVQAIKSERGREGRERPGLAFAPRSCARS
jgi:CBS domain-containing protein